MRLVSLLVCLLLVSSACAEVTQDSDGFTVVTPSTDSQIIYVSSSTGIDSNDGLSESTPVETLAHAYSLARTGYPDHILLKRGDTWEQEHFTANWGLSGRSAEEPMLVGSYGEGPRPLLRFAGSCIPNESNGPVANFVVFADLHLYNYATHPDSPDYDPSTITSGTLVGNGFKWRGGGDSILIENCWIQNYSIGVEITNRSSTPSTNMIVRRNVIFQNRGQGMLVLGQTDCLIEENIVDSNGWYDRDSEIKQHQGTTKKHGLYITNINNSGITVRNNIIHDSCSHGIHFRPGGVCTGNLMLSNPIGIETGYPNNEDDPDSTHGIVSLIAQNIIENGSDINAKAHRGSGIIVKDTSDCTVEDNVVINVWSRETNTYGFQVLEFGNPPLPALGVKIRNNVSWNWERGGVRTQGTVEITENSGNYFWGENNVGQGNFKAEETTFTDPLRSVGQYHRTQVGSKGQFGTSKAFVDFAKSKWNKSDWDPQYMPQTVVPWIQAGFTPSQ